MKILNTPSKLICGCVYAGADHTYIAERFRRDEVTKFIDCDTMSEFWGMIGSEFSNSCSRIYEVCFSEEILYKSANYLPSNVYSQLVKSNVPMDDIAALKQLYHLGFVILIEVPGATEAFITQNLSTYGDNYTLCIDFSKFAGSKKISLQTFLLSHLFSDHESSTNALEWLKRNQKQFLIIINNFVLTSTLTDKNLLRCDYDTLLAPEELVIHLLKKYFLPNATILLVTFPQIAVNVLDIVRPDASFLPKIPTQDVKAIASKNAGHFSAHSLEDSVKSPWLLEVLSCPLLLFIFLKISSVEAHMAKECFSFTQFFEVCFDHIYLIDVKASKKQVFIQHLAGLSYQAICNTKLKIAAFSFQDGDKQSIFDLHLKLGAISLKLCRKLGDSAYFCLQVFQEYFAMIYILDVMTLEDFRRFVCMDLFTSEWVIVRKFVCGLLMDIRRKNGECLFCSYAFFAALEMLENKYLEIASKISTSWSNMKCLFRFSRDLLKFC